MRGGGGGLNLAAAHLQPAAGLESGLSTQMVSQTLQLDSELPFELERMSHSFQEVIGHAPTDT